MIKYNPTYDRWVTDKGEVYKKDKSGNLVLCKQHYDTNGYLMIRIEQPKKTILRVHRLVYMTFKGTIPKGMEIDHQDTHRDNNELSNLKLCTHKENCNNPKTIERRMGNTNAAGNTNTKGRTFSEFGRKFKEHFGITKYENTKLYNREWEYWKTHNKRCRWE